MEVDKNSLSIDELFVINFKTNGGIFIYCKSQEELMNSFLGILSENQHIKSFYSSTYQEFFQNFPDNFFSDCFNEDSLFVTQCEYLIAEKGEILFSSTQLGQKRIKYYPNLVLVVVAKVSQIVATSNDSLRLINRKYSKSYPNNISPINPKMVNCKVYLLLQEDLT